MSIKKKTKTIESRIRSSLIFFVLSMFVILWTVLILYFNYAYKNFQLDVIYLASEKIKNVEDDVDIDVLLDNIAYENDICIIKVEADEVRGEYNTKMSGCGLLFRNEKLDSIIFGFSSSTATDKLFEFINEAEEVQAALLATKKDETSIFLYTNLKDINQFTSLFYNKLIYLTIVFVVLSTIFSYLISKKIVEPLSNITKNAKLIGSSDEAKFEKNGIYEIDNLATALTLAQNEIGKTHEFKRDLMANVSHDLKTPLTMIKAYAEMCRDISYKNKEKLDEHLNIIIDETNRLTVLVNDILEASKLGAKKQVLQKEKYDLSLEIKKIIKKYEIIKETEDYNFIVNVPSKIIVNADKNKINQVIYNLINNAINYTGEDKTVIINIKKKNMSYLIEIIDTGKGILEKDLPFIWDKYYKTDKKHKRNVISTGIGLSIVKEIFLLHDFKYGVESSEKGTKFFFIVK
ncbi:MAG: HAMP domain-containing sensor histidine kinase [bacterium]